MENLELNDFPLDCQVRGAERMTPSQAGASLAHDAVSCVTGVGRCLGEPMKNAALVSARCKHCSVKYVG